MPVSVKGYGWSRTFYMETSTSETEFRVWRRVVGVVKDFGLEFVAPDDMRILERVTQRWRWSIEQTIYNIDKKRRDAKYALTAFLKLRGLSDSGLRVLGKMGLTFTDRRYRAYREAEISQVSKRTL